MASVLGWDAASNGHGEGIHRNANTFENGTNSSTNLSIRDINWYQKPQLNNSNETEVTVGNYSSYVLLNCLYF
jgi:hypothetical protein